MRVWGRVGLVPAVLTLLALVACNGGGTGEEGPEGSPVAGVTDLCQPLAKAERYRYSFTYKVESLKPTGEIDVTAVGDPPFALPADAPDFQVTQTLDGSVQNPQRVEMTIRTEGTGDLQMVFIGPDQWILTGDRWIKRQAELVPFAPLDVCNAMLLGLDLTGAEATEDSVDGEKVLRYEVKAAELQTAVKLWTQQSDMGRLLKTYDVSVWLSDKGKAPVRMESRTIATYPSGRELSMDLSLTIKDVNAGDIKIEPPS